ncbi:WD40-repeat-containing domain protein [Leucosporidium creatinivorum]|uniref:WD40-repeat-containing domain protein n=1 Tax=Leucosporidium creatinivorum TaxID=106004 RepID=A0A1Y2G3F7_9BASI|nr:WD40-repeat-containing domain protein [Leucosporidium creatinivorum]
MASEGIDFADLEHREMDIEESASHPETARLLAELDRKQSARRIAVPTKDADVRLRLREMGEPITLFGERPEDRRDRLRYLWSQQRQKEKDAKMQVGSDEEEESSSGSEDEDEEKEEEFYTEGTLDLKAARKDIAEFSLPRARKRVARQRSETSIPLGRLIDVRRAVFSNLKSFTNLGSQIGDTRALSSLRFSPDSSMLLTSSWTGTAKLWSVPACKEIKTIKAHKERIGGVAWHPQATLSQSRTATNFATSGADNDIKLWGLDGDAPLQTLSGHSARVCRIGFHPSGRYLGSASYDGTWRLWDVERGGEELLLQEGHSKEVYSIAFQGDGSLVCTGGLDAIGRVWDLRSGKTCMVLDGHVKDILAIDFSPNGHQIATGSNDDTIRIWDLRSLKSIYTIPAHKSAISDLKFFHAPPSSPSSYPSTSLPRGFASLDVFAESKGEADKSHDADMVVDGEEKPDYPISGSFLVSGGYDGMVKIWSADDWQQVKSMTSDQSGKVMSVDVSADARFIASAEYSRTFKLWSHPDVDLD